MKSSKQELKRFRDRYGMHSLNTQGESLSADLSSVEPFREQFLKIVANDGKCMKYESHKCIHLRK